MTDKLKLTPGRAYILGDDGTIKSLRLGDLEDAARNPALNDPTGATMPDANTTSETRHPTDYRRGLTDGIAIVAYALRYLDMTQAANVADRAYGIAKELTDTPDHDAQAQELVDALRSSVGPRDVPATPSQPAD